MTHPIKVIGLDMDGVLCDLHRPWLRWIKEHLDPRRDISKGFLSWDEPVESYGPRVFDFLTPTVYHADIAGPIPGALEAVEKIRAVGYSIKIISSCLNDTDSSKIEWALRHGFIYDAKDFIPMKKKTFAPVDMLVDDHVVNCRDFMQGNPGKISILVNDTHNIHEPWKYLRVDGLSDVAALLTAIHPKEERTMQLDQSNAISYVKNVATRILPFVRSHIVANGSISANDVRNSTVFAVAAREELLTETETPSAIVLAFRLAGLKPSGRKTANTVGSARYRKVAVWVPANL